MNGLTPVSAKVRGGSSQACRGDCGQSSLLPLFSPFGHDFINQLFGVATTQQRIILIILSPIKDVAVIGPRCFDVLPDFLELPLAQLQDVPPYPIAFRSRVAGKQLKNTILVRAFELSANTFN